MATDPKRAYRRLPWLIAVVMLAVLGIGAGLLSALEHRLVAIMRDSLAWLAADIARALDRTLFERYGDIQMVAQIFGTSIRDAKTQTQYLIRLKETHRDYRWLAIADARGRIVAATDPGSVGQDRSGTEWFRAAAGGTGVHLQDVSVSEDANDRRVVGVSARITGAQGEFLGVVTGQVGLSELEGVFRQESQTFLTQHHERTVEWQLVGRDGSLILDAPLRDEGRIDVRQLDLLPSATIGLTAGPGYVEERPRGRRLSVVTGYAQSEGYGEFPGFHWRILVRMDRDEILTSIWTFLWKVGAGGALIVFPLLGLLLWTSRHMRMESEQASAQLDRLKGLNCASHALRPVENLREPGLSIPELLQLVLDTAVQLTGARYGAVGQCDESGQQLVQFLTTGMDDTTKSRIGGWLTGRGRLGFLAQEGDVLRLKDLTHHPIFSGFPPDYPPMRSFLGVSIRAHGRLFGRIYLTDKRGADEFSEIDEQVIAALAAEAGVVIENGLFLSQIQAAERLYRTTMIALPVSVVRLDQHGTIRFANPRFYELIQRDEADSVGRSIASVLQVDGQGEGMDDLLQLARVQGEPVAREVDWVNQAGEARVLQTSIVGMNPAAADFILIAEDLTERKQAEREREKLTRDRLALLDATDEGIYGLDLNGCCTFINKAGAAMLGYETEELLGKRMHELIHHARRDGSPYPVEECSICRAFRTGQGCRLDNERLWRKAGTSFQAECCSNPIFEGERIVGSVATFNDITERLGAEEALRASEERFRQLTETIEQVFWVTTPDKSQMLYVSSAFEKIWGQTCESLYASPRGWLAAIHPEDRERVLEAAQGKQASGEYHEEYRIVRPDGSVRWILDRAFPVRDASGEVRQIAGVAEDITERKALEEQLRQVQKMEAVGQLAGGIAHDFSNLLTVINGYSEMLLLTHQQDDPWFSSVQEIQRAGEQAAALTQQLLTFSRKQVVQPRRLDLNVVVTDMEKMLRRLIGEPIEVVIRRAADLGCVKADIGQLKQIILNLAVNARDAMPEGGRLVIETANVELNAARRQPPALQPGSYVTLAIRDNGAGMDAATQARIFEPFFTTKEPDKGTGLGLATVYGIVTQSGGHIGVDSEPGRGTTVTIYLPRIDGAPEEIRSSHQPVILPEGSETILLVEDEEAVRSLARAILSSNGYTVLEANRGEEAVRISDEHAGSIHLLLTDVVMPGMNGHQLAERLMPMRSEMKALYISGCTDDVVARSGVLEQEGRLLRKPFTPHALARKVREMLESA